ncbi:MAG: Type 4 fimbrial assembly protein pilC [uncultured bacterium]|nr:MAG: Type 4 fimbrial assembly protein pilC [uncultured bacterium]
MFVQNLSLMIKTGFSMGEALQTLAEQTSDRMLRTIIQTLHQDVIKGISFAAALQKHPATFDELFVNMVAAGETSGNLEKTLTQLHKQMKKSYALKRKIRNAMIYPILILSFMSVVGVGMFIFVIPKIIDLYTSSGYTLPLPTRILIAVSNFVSDNLLLLASGVAALLLGGFITLRTEAGKIIWHRILLRLPVFGRIIKKVNIAQFSRLLNSLIVTDIPIVTGLQIIAQTVGNRAYRTHLLKGVAALNRGSSISSILIERKDLYDPVVVQMIKVGEEAGVLDTMTQEIAEFYEEEVDATLSNLTVIIEPLLMIIIGIGVGFLAVSIILPIYALVEQI